MTYVGIDPGLSGAVAWIKSVSEKFALDTITVLPTPTMAKGKSGRQFDETACWRLICDLPRPMFVCLEHAQSMPSQGAPSGFNYGVGWGMWRGMLTASEDCQWQIVRPTAWQKVMLAGVPHGSGETKSASITVAKRLFGGVSLKRTDKCRKDCDGLSDALLLAEYGRRIHEGKA